MIYVRIWDKNIIRCQYLTLCSYHDLEFWKIYPQFCLVGYDGFGFPCINIPRYTGELSKKTVFVEDDIAFFPHLLFYQG